MEEDEARMEEEIRQEEEVTDTEMADEEERVIPSPLAPMGRLIPRAPLHWSLLEMLSPPEEDALLMQPASQPEDPTTGSHSPRSETATVFAEMAELCLASPSQPGHEEDETQP